MLRAARGCAGRRESQGEPHLLLLHRFEVLLVSTFLTGGQAFADVGGPLDLARGDHHLVEVAGEEGIGSRMPIWGGDGGVKGEGDPPPRSSAAEGREQKETPPPDVSAQGWERPHFKKGPRGISGKVGFTGDSGYSWGGGESTP